jgi:hypothetical protein
MIVLVHVLIALSSIVSSTLLAVFPSKAKLYLSSGLIASTLVSGTILVLVTHSSILKSCITGLVYLAVVMAEVAVGSRSMASKTQEK